MEEGDLEQASVSVNGSGPVSETSGSYNHKTGIRADGAAGRVYRKIADAPTNHIPLIDKVVDVILDGLKSNKR